MAGLRDDTLLTIAAELDARDEALAAQIAVVASLAERAGAVRSRAAEIATQLKAIPVEQEATAAAEVHAHDAEREAQSELAIAEGRLEALERARRRDEAAIATARRSLRDAQEAVTDASHRRERLEARRVELHDQESALQKESEGLAVSASDVAAALRDAPRIADAGKGDPGTTLAQIEEWGGRARAALFVARGTLDNERERVVAEANALAEAVLGEQPSGTSVALVRRRLERALG